MKLRHVLTLAFALSFANAFAAAPAGAPAGSTALCKDGSYYSGAQKKGACRGHKGIKDWYGEAAPKKDEAGGAKTGTQATAPATGAAPATSGAPATGAAPARGTATAQTASHRSAPPQPAAVAAAGGGAGKVWANDATKVYHCQGDRWYGKTKQGEYMSQSEAQAKGFKAARGKACS
jgi:hypothetical protein